MDLPFTLVKIHLLDDGVVKNKCLFDVCTNKEGTAGQ